MDQNMTSYFQTLSELLLSLQVSDGSGAALSLDEGASDAVNMILAVKAASGKVMAIGNGGSAAIASHMHNDLCKAVRVQAIVFHETPLLTALSNDDGYERALELGVELWARSGDLLIAISSSGQSENILRAVRTSLARECRVITLSGFDADNPLRRMGHLNFYVPSHSYGYVEVAHSTLSHFLTDCAVESVSEVRD